MVPGTNERSVLDQVEDLRRRLFRVIMVFGPLFFGLTFFGRDLFFILKKPLMGALPPDAQNLHFTGPMDVFLAYLKVSFLVAAAICLPYFFLQVFFSLKPLLPPSSRKATPLLFGSSVGLFFAGVAFCYFLIFPMAMDFLIGLGEGSVTPLITVEEYLSITILMHMGFGLTFQFPILVIILERLGIVSDARFKKNRGTVAVVLLVIAAIVTPTPDPVSQLSMAVPMYVMFEVALLVIWYLKRKEAAASKTAGRDVSRS